MPSIADAFLEQKSSPCPVCRGMKRLYLDGSVVECFRCGGKGFVKHYA